MLLAEPDETLAGQAVTCLRDEGISTTVCASGAEALLRFGLSTPDVVLLAAKLPVVPASTVVVVIRQQATTPVIIGMGDTDAEEAGKALAAGATACIAHPYRLPELLTLLRPTHADPARADGGDAVLRAGTVRLDPAAYDVRVDGRPVHLPPREFELLEYLMRHKGQVVTTDQIRRDVWGPGGDSNTITVHVRRLRAKLGDTPRDPRIIQTVRGRGYRVAGHTPPDAQPSKR